MTANSKTRLNDILPEFGVKNKINGHIGVTPLHMMQHIGHGRAESVEIALCPSFIFIVAYWFTCPTVIGSSKDKNEAYSSFCRIFLSSWYSIAQIAG